MTTKCALVVDDSKPCRQICQLILTRAGYHTVAASSYSEALQVLKKREPDILVCDMLLGVDGTGLDVVAAVRSTGRKIYSIAISAMPTKEVRKAALAAGFDAFLYKPFKPDQLVALLAGAMNKSSR